MKRVLAGIFFLCSSVLTYFYINGSFKPINSAFLNVQKAIYINSSSFLVNSSKCEIMNLDPFDSQVMPFYERTEYVPCTKHESLLTYVTKGYNAATLHIKMSALKSYAENSNVTCCYANISRETGLSDDDYNMSLCIDFNNYVTFGHDFVKVSCNRSNGELIYENTHAPVIVRSDVRKKLELVKTKQHAFSVLFLGIDSVSRLNFIRSLPNSYKFLMDNNWVSFRGYNKIADNTYPNLMAILAGYDKRASFSKCKPETVSNLNNCSLVWSDFRKLGYVTAYAEDETHLSTFNLNKLGFNIHPTDYYFRSYFLAAEKRMQRSYLHGMSYCTGPETSGERVLNIAKDFAMTFIKNPSFGLFWMNTFSHNNLNAPSTMDDKIRQFLQDITNEGILENSIVIFLSDHGMRFGAFRDSAMGWLEERLPFFFMWVPHRFRQEFPNEYINLRKNANKLTNPYDLYMTLQHILVLSKFNYTIKPSEACSSCKSLFTDIDSERSCEDIAINPHWCTCTDFSPLNQSSQVVKTASIFVLDQIHKAIHAKKRGYLCAKYSIYKVLASNTFRKVTNETEKYILLVIETRPKAMFEVMVSYQEENSQKFKIQDGIFVIDSYEERSGCTSNKQLKKYCFCLGYFPSGRNGEWTP